MNNFQTIVIAIFLAFFVFAVLIFSGLLKIGGSSSSSSSNLSGKVVIWGTWQNGPELLKVFEDIASVNKDLTITYVKKSEATYQQDLVEAIARGTGPDLYIITPSMILKNKSFIYPIPYASYSAKTFSDAFIDGASVYLASDGVIGFPIAVDPIVMYYNKDILSNEGIVAPPKYWNELFDLNTKLTKKADDGTINQSMIALGQYDNVLHAKDIIATLLFQSGNPIVKASSGVYTAALSDNPSSLPTPPAEQVMNFYTEFANPTDAAYSWNRALPKSLNLFTGGKLAMYLGRASELFTIQSVNPNLSFDVTEVPQTKGVNIRRTDADIYAVVVNKKSTNITSAFGVAGQMSSGDNAKNLAIAVALPPALRSLLAIKPVDPYLFTFFNSAIIAKSWIDPDSRNTDSIFNELISNINSGKLMVADAISKAESELDSIIPR